MIPKIIHFCWLSGEPYPDLVKKCMQSWNRYLPDYKIMIWTTENFDVDICPYTREAFDKKKYAFVSDYVRLYALYEFGGIYLDSDIEVLRNFDSLLNNIAFSGFESSDRIAAWIFGSEARNPLFEELLKYYDGRHFLHNGKMDLTPNPIPITNCLKKHGLQMNNKIQELDLIKIYPIDYFATKDLETGKVVITENSYTIHHFNGAWMDDELRRYQEKRREVNKCLKKYIPDSISSVVAGIIGAYSTGGLTRVIKMTIEKIKR